jgi:hypothetical protein
MNPVRLVGAHSFIQSCRARKALSAPDFELNLDGAWTTMLAADLVGIVHGGQP